MGYLESDDYIDYLKKNCGVRGYDIPEQSPTFSGAGIDIFLNYMKLFCIKNHHNVLEVGCGLGRILKEFHDVFGTNLFGIDNNKKVIELAKERVSKICSELKYSMAEEIDFPNSFFDRIFCWGVFDLTEQEKCLIEMTRCLKINGLLLVTGKSHNYHDDDIEALSAETAITEKKIKHFFTNYEELIEFASLIGMEPIHERFFQRRGYFMKNKFDLKKPDNFYEWLIIFRKSQNISSNNISKKFSMIHSKVYSKMNLAKI